MNATTAQRRAGTHAPAIILFLVTTVVLLAVDLGSKSIAFRTVAGVPVDVSLREDGTRNPMPMHPPKDFIPGVLSLHLTTNEGAVFGLGQGGRWFFIPFSIVAMGVIGAVFWNSRAKAWVLHLALGAVLSGALGNLYDRVQFGAVRDMMWLFPGRKLPFGWTWPDGSAELYPWIFNVADVALVFGVILLVFLMLRGEGKPDPPNSRARDST